MKALLFDIRNGQETFARSLHARAMLANTSSTPSLQRVGFYNAAPNELHSTARGGTLDTAFVIDTLDAWAATRTRPTVLVLDNALHHAAACQARLGAWEAQSMHVFCLPTCSPHPNKIETRWRKIKYEWLRPEAYATCQTLKMAVWHILDRVGLQCRIQFNS